MQKTQAGPKPVYRMLYFWVAMAIIAGAALGHFQPEAGAALKPVADGFIALIKMLIAPIVFCTVALGVSGASDVKKAGRVGLKSILYFEVMSTLALAIGLAVGNWAKPGAGFATGNLSSGAPSASEFARQAEATSATQTILHAIPKTFIDAFTAQGDLIQTVLVAVLFGWALTRIGPRAEKLRESIDSVGQAFFAMIGAVMRLAPIGAGAAMAYTVGKFGVRALGPLAYFMGCFYFTCAGFVIIGLGLVAHRCGFNIFSLIKYLRSELLLVLGTSSSESALAPLMQKLERLGCSKSTVGLVVPSGYSFNLDGTNIYLSLAVLFIAQATGVDLSLGDQLAILAVAMLTSKGAAAVTGGGFVVLAATLAAVPQVPVAGLALIIGIDRFMSEARALTNLLGNAVATIAIARWEGEVSAASLNKELANP